MADANVPNPGAESAASGKPNPDLSNSSGPGIRIMIPGSPDVLVRLEGMPTDLLARLSDPPKSSLWTDVFKDVVPGLTSLAAVLISLAALIYTNHQKKVSEVSAQEQREKADDAAKKRVLVDLIKNFGRTVPQAANGTPEPELELMAMKLAAYGNQAMPAVRMALGADDGALRHGGVLVAEQIYRAETMKQGELTQEILGYYGARSPVLRQGVLEWLVKMGHELSPDEATLAVNILTNKFGVVGENCQQEDVQVAMEVTNFLPIWPTSDSKALMEGMSRTCPDNEVRLHAADALKRMNSNSH